MIIKITFELNEKKELYITIEEEGRKNIRVIAVNNNTIDCNENVEKRIEEAKNNVEKDLQKKKNIEAKLELNNLINEINENKKIYKDRSYWRGSTRIPKIQEMIEQFFNKKDIILKVIQQDEAIHMELQLKLIIILISLN